jgi:hypothetical protein
MIQALSDSFSPTKGKTEFQNANIQKSKSSVHTHNNKPTLLKRGGNNKQERNHNTSLTTMKD